MIFTQTNFSQSSEDHKIFFLARIFSISMATRTADVDQMEADSSRMSWSLQYDRCQTYSNFEMEQYADARRHILACFSPEGLRLSRAQSEVENQQ